MRKLYGTALIAVLVAATACRDPAGIDGALEATDAAVSATPAGVVASVTGSAHQDQAAGEGRTLRAFTISAVKRADGVTSGQYQLTSDWPFGPDGPPVLQAHGTITCIRVDGNRAYVGGTIDDRNFFEGFPITGIAVELVDNGEGSGTAPDEVSSLGLFVANPDGPQDFCDAATPGPVSAIDRGNLTVR